MVKDINFTKPSFKHIVNIAAENSYYHEGPGLPSKVKGSTISNVFVLDRIFTSSFLGSVAYGC